MNDTDLMRLLWCAIMFLLMIDLALAMVAVFLVERLRRYRRVISKLSAPEIRRDTNGRRIQERI